MMEAQGSGCREDPPAGGLVRLGADTLQKNKFMMEAKASGCREDQPPGGLVRHGADTLQENKVMMEAKGRSIKPSLQDYQNSN